METVILGLSAAGLVALAIVVLRRALPTGSVPRLQRGKSEAVAVLSDGSLSTSRDLRWSRWLFYAGSLTVCESSFRVALGLSFSELAFIASFGGCVFAVIRGRGIAPVPSGLVAGAAVFAVGGAISSVGADSPGASVSQLLHAIYVMVLWVWTGVMVLRTRRQLLLAVTLWSCSAALNGVAALSQVAGFHALAGPLEGSRATGFTAHANDLGGSAAVALVPAMLLATASRDRMVAGRWLHWTVLVLVGLGLVLSGSIAAMLAGLIAIVAWLSSPVVRVGGRTALLMVVAIALAGIVMAGGSVSSPTQRLQQVTTYSATSDAGTAEARIAIVKAAWPRIVKDPIVGTGLDVNGTVVTVFRKGIVTAYQAHIAPVAAAYEAGIFGLVGIVMIFGAVATAGWKALKRALDSDDVVLGWGLLAAFVAFIVYALTAPLSFQQFGWIAGVALSAWALRRPAFAPARARQRPGTAIPPQPRWPEPLRT